MLQDSAFVRKCRAEGFVKGLEEGRVTMARAAVVHALQARFPEEPVPIWIRFTLEKKTDVSQLIDWLREAVVTASLADFEGFLCASHR